jgi:hypothetical protein
MHWGEVPTGTEEIAIGIVIYVVLPDEGGFASKHVDEWLIGNLAPVRRRLLVGPLPSGSFLKGHGRILRGKVECPPPGVRSGFDFSVYALSGDRRLHRFETVDLSTLQTLEENALAVGSVSALYGGVKFKSN